MATEQEQADSFHPPITDSKGSIWTWRGQGYAIVSQPDRTPDGKPWTVTGDTIRRLFGIHATATIAKKGGPK